jgi:hypothetical protein
VIVWEYNLIVANISAFMKPDISRLWRQKGPEGKTDWDRVQQSGHEGWELVNCFPMTTGSGATIEVAWVFKRQRTQ